MSLISSASGAAASCLAWASVAEALVSAARAAQLLVVTEREEPINLRKLAIDSNN
ncbi:MAG: hypothetical protein Q8P67_20365 [archaeon]|nr:hypothetical protein [archaeon]